MRDLNLGPARSVHTRTLHDTTPIEAGRGVERSPESIHLKNEQGQGHTVAIEKRLYIYIYIHSGAPVRKL